MTEGTSAKYRIYRLNKDGDIVAGADADCSSEDTAFAWAKTVLQPGEAAEVWMVARCVGRVSRLPQGAEAEADQGSAATKTA